MVTLVANSDRCPGAVIVPLQDDPSCPKSDSSAAVEDLPPVPVPGPPLALGEEATIPLAADRGKRAGCRPQGMGDEGQTASPRGPLHLRGFADKFAGKPAVDGVRVPDVDP